VANLSKPLVVRFGFRPVLSGGLVASAAGLLVLSTSGARSGPWVFEVGLGLIGLGIGLTMPPATGAIMSSRPPHKAGVGSAVNDLVRELGGALGIGVLGSLTLSRYQTRLAPVLDHDHAATGARHGLTQAFAIGGGPDSAIGLAARSAYASGLDLAMAVGAAFVLVAAVVVYLTMPVPPRGAAVPLRAIAGQARR
jgi:hypothetical protein